MNDILTIKPTENFGVLKVFFKLDPWDHLELPGLGLLAEMLIAFRLSATHRLVRDVQGHNYGIFTAYSMRAAGLMTMLVFNGRRKRQQTVREK